MAEKIQKKKRSRQYNFKKKGCDQARGINIGEAFQHWRDLKEREGLKTDSEVALFLLNT